MLPLITTPWAVLVLASRVWLGHHTWAQVAAGCTFGVFFAWFWFELWIRGGYQWGELIEQEVEPLVERLLYV